MKINCILGLLILSGFCFSFFSCESSKAGKDNEPQEIIQEPIVDDTSEENAVEDIIISDYSDSDEVEYVEESDSDDEEYYRSINNIDDFDSVSKKDFIDDKAAILKIISELSDVMETKDARIWKNYIEPDSIRYYSNPVNLRNAQKKLPNKTVVLTNIDDYFFYVFIPSRKRSRVDEIRYISKTNIKAVQVKEDFSTVVYYYFKKIDDKWYVHLPPV